MLQSITELMVRIADLCEAEGRTLRTSAVRLALGVAVILIAAITLAAGVLLLLAAVFVAVQTSAGPAIAALVTGLLALAAGGTLAWLGRRIGS